MEQITSYLEVVRRWDEDGHKNVPLVEVVKLLIACILHLENTVGEKIIITIIRSCFDCWVGSPLTLFIHKMKDAFQKKVLGSEVSPSHWKLKYIKAHDAPLTIDPIQVWNNVDHCMITLIDAIVEAEILN
jgi:hypothetical protein